MVVVAGQVEVGYVRPGTAFVVVAVRLVIGVHHHLMVGKFHRKEILSPGRYGRGSFRTQNETLRQLGISLVVMLGFVVEAGNVEGGGKAIVDNGVYLVHPTGDGARAVESADRVAQAFQFIHAGFAPLAGDFVADGPHDHRRVIPVLAYHVCHVAVGPFLENRSIAIG